MQYTPDVFGCSPCHIKAPLLHWFAWRFLAFFYPAHQRQHKVLGRWRDLRAYCQALVDFLGELHVLHPLFRLALPLHLLE